MDEIDALKAENAHMSGLIEACANHWLALQDHCPLKWEGAVDGAFKAACDEIRRLNVLLNPDAMSPAYLAMKEGYRIDEA